MSTQRKKPTMVVRAGEVEDIIDYLQRLILIYNALGLPEDAKRLIVFVAILERRLYGGPKA
jgi:hypothetical protein